MDSKVSQLTMLVVKLVRLNIRYAAVADAVFKLNTAAA